MAFKAGSIYGEAVLDTRKWSGGLKSLTKGTLAFVGVAGAAFTAAMVKNVAEANAFQKEMSNVSTVIDTTKISTQSLTKQLLNLDPALGETKDLTQGLYQSFSAGARTAEEAMQTTVDSAKFAKAGLTDTNTAVDVLTTAVNAYGRETMSTTSASDIFFTTIKQGKITGEQLASTIGQSIPLFASTGIKLEELSAGMAAMTKQGISSSEATTQLNAIVNSFLKPSEQMTEALKEMGHESGSTFLEAEGLAGALKLVEERTGGDAAAISELLPNIRGMRGAMALTGVGGEEFTSILGEMENATGATDEAFEKQEKTFDTLRSQMGKVSIVTGNIAKHFVDEIAVGATTASRSMLQFLTSSSGMEFIANLVGGVAGGFDLLKAVIAPITETLFPILKGLIDDVQSAMIDVNGGTQDAAGAMKILSIGTNLVSTGLTVAGKVLHGFIEMTRDMIIGIKSSSDTLGSFFAALTGKGTWDDVKTNAGNTVDAFKSLGSNFISNVGEVYKTARDEIKNFSGETEALTANLNAVVETSFTRAKNNVLVNYGEMITGQQDFSEALAQSMLEAGAAVEDVDDDITENVKSNTDEWKEAWDERVQSVRQYGDMALSTMSTITDSLFNIESMSLENRIAREEEAYNKSISLLDEKLENDLISQAEYDEQAAMLEEEKNTKLNELGQKAFDAEQKNKKSSLWINEASAIMGWWESASILGPIAGPAFASAMSAFTLVTAAKQASLIDQQTYVPSYAQGGTASGVSRFNEAGGEIMNLPDGTVIVPNDISARIADSVGGGGTQINIYNPSVRKDSDIDRLVNEIDRRLGRRLKTA